MMKWNDWSAAALVLFAMLTLECCRPLFVDHQLPHLSRETRIAMIRRLLLLLVIQRLLFAYSVVLVVTLSAYTAIWAQLLECPSGIVTEDNFKDIYAKFFPYGDSATYAHHVFNAFDVHQCGRISFKHLIGSLSTLLRGDDRQKLLWAFNIYDTSGDGYITRKDVARVMMAVHDLIGHACTTHPRQSFSSSVDEVFDRLDVNADGIVTQQEFVDACQTV